MNSTSGKYSCLLIVDLQNDFCPGGALAVKGGDLIVAPLNRILPRFSTVITTQDWHPENHCSFHQQGGPWPPHCIRHTQGARLHPRLSQEGILARIFKGTSPFRDAYSGFQETELENILKQKGIAEIYLAGLAADYCVKHTALDAIRKGFKVTVIRDLTRSVEAHPGDGARAFGEILEAGGSLVTSRDLR